MGGYFNDKREEGDEFFKECVREANIIINHHKNKYDDRISQAHTVLVTLYTHIGDYEKAKEDANKLPLYYGWNKGTALAGIIAYYDKKQYNDFLFT